MELSAGRGATASLSRVRRRRADGRSAGFSIIEVLVAAVILFVVALGIIPLFTRSLSSNLAGADATSASQYGISRIEELYQLDFNNPLLDPATTDEYYSIKDKTWKPGTTPPDDDPALWTRKTEVTQYGVSGLFDDDGKFVGAQLPLDTDPELIHIKQIVVTVASARNLGNPLGVRRELKLRTLKSF
jgi:type II secretory pathway pseudopilin PulG